MKARKTIKIDIINDDALKLLQDLEDLNLIRLHEVKKRSAPTWNAADWIKRFKGSLAPQPQSEVDKQLRELRNSWE